MQSPRGGQLVAAFLFGLVGGTWTLEMLAIGAGRAARVPLVETVYAPSLHPLLIAFVQLLVAGLVLRERSQRVPASTSVGSSTYLHDAI